MSLIKLIVSNDSKQNKAIKRYLTPQSRKQLLQDVTAKEALLHSIYVSEVNTNDIILTDAYMSKITGWSLRAVQKLRLGLEHKEWLKIKQLKDKETGNSYTEYYLQKERIQASFSNSKVNTDKEIKEILDNASPAESKIIAEIVAEAEAA